MIKIITTVGTSLITNYKASTNGKDKDFNDDVATLEDKAATYYNENIERINDVKSKLQEFVKDPQNSAEMGTVENWCKDESIETQVSVFLLCTDSILSKLVAEVIRENFQSNKISIKKPVVLEGIQVKDSDHFEQIGYQNFITAIKNIVNNSLKEERIVFNISGGFKALIPISTIVAQLLDLEIIYNYETKSEVIRFPQLPIQLDSWLLEKLLPVMFMIESDISADINSLKNEYPDIVKNLEKIKLIRKTKDKFSLTPLGRLVYSTAQMNEIQANDAFGFIAELKLFEYLSKESENKTVHVRHSYRLTELDPTICGNTWRELDIVEWDSNNSISKVFECKSLLNTLNPTKFIEGQLRYQLKGLKFKKIYPQEYIYCFYVPVGYAIRKANGQVVLKNEKIIAKKLNEIKKEIDSILEDKVIFRAAYFVVQVNVENPGQSAFQNFVKYPIKLHEFNIN